jgi:inorganic pyrophosphatase
MPADRTLWSKTVPERHVPQPFDPNAFDQGTQLDVVIEIPKWSFLKRGSTGQLDFVSPLPCPFNYGSAPDYVGLEGDLLDVLVLGPRLPRGTRIKVKALGAVGLTERGMYDDKIVGSQKPLARWQPPLIVGFFHFYACCKWLLNVLRGHVHVARCEGWGSADDAIARAKPCDASWRGPEIGF